jgi:hypothetical protein
MGKDWRVQNPEARADRSELFSNADYLDYADFADEEKENFSS